jgi:hypothetical protein
MTAEIIAFPRRPARPVDFNELAAVFRAILEDIGLEAGGAFIRAALAVAVHRERERACDD